MWQGASATPSSRFAGRTRERSDATVGIDSYVESVGIDSYVESVGIDSYVESVGVDSDVEYIRVVQVDDVSYLS